MNLSPHFTLAEMTASDYAARHGIDNSPDPDVVSNLRRLCLDVLEPLREWAGGPVIITSGYRCKELNRAIGGSLVSAHMLGRAADLWVPGKPLVAVYDWLAGTNLPIDQQIYEFGAWIHASIAPFGADPRRQCLMKFHGRPYETYDPAVARAISG